MPPRTQLASKVVTCEVCQRSQEAVFALGESVKEYFVGKSQQFVKVRQDFEKI